MTFDPQQILAAKRAHRHTLATRDILEKLGMLDALRERTTTCTPVLRARGLRASAKTLNAPTGLDSKV